MLAYRPGNDLWHRLDGLTVLAYSGALFALALAFNHPLCLAGLASLAVLALAEAVGWREVKGFWRFYLFMAIPLVIINVLINHSGSTPLYPGAPFSWEAFAFSLAMCLRLLAILAAFGLFSASVRVEELLNRSSFLAGPVGLTLGMGLRLFPALLAEQERITFAQRARGVRLATGPRLVRLRNLAAVWQPLLLNTLERAWQLGEVMQARGLGSTRRSAFVVERRQRRDYLVLAGATLGLAGGLLAAWQGAATFNFYPRLDSLWPPAGHPQFNPLMIGLVLPVCAAWRWRR